MRLCRLASGFACSIALTGCLNNFNNYVNPAPPPAPSAVLEEFTAFDNAWTALRAKVVDSETIKQNREQADRDTARYFVTSGYDLAATNCIVFFDRIRNLRNQTNFAKDLLVSIASASGLIAGIAGASTSALTAIIGGTGIIPSAVDEFNKTFLLSDIADAVSPAVLTGMAEYRASYKAEEATRWNAAQFVREHARICTVPFMVDLAKRSISNTTVVVSKDDKKDEPKKEDKRVGTSDAKSSSASAAKSLGQNGQMTIQAIK